MGCGGVGRWRRAAAVDRSLARASASIPEPRRARSARGSLFTRPPAQPIVPRLPTTSRPPNSHAPRPHALTLLLAPPARAAVAFPAAFSDERNNHGNHGLHPRRTARDHRVQRRLARHHLPGGSPTTTARSSAARSSSSANRRSAQFVYLGQFGDTFGPGKHTLDHRQHPDPLHAQGLEVRLRIAVQGRRLLRQHPAVHRQQVGHAAIRS